MCFAPQWRALVEHLSIQKWSERGAFCKFWLGNVLCATVACTFSTSQLPKVARGWSVFNILTWKCASCQWRSILDSPMTRCLHTRRFSEPTFRPSGAWDLGCRFKWGWSQKLSALRRGGGPRLRSDKAWLNHGVGAGSWGTRKRCFCSTFGFWPFVGFYVDMLGPRFFPLGQPLS